MSSRTLFGTLLLIVLTTLITLAGFRIAAAASHTVTCNAGAATQLQSVVNAAGPGDTIFIPACTIVLTTALSINGKVTIVGAGSDLTVLDGAGATTVVSVSGVATVAISDVTIRNGFALNSGGFNSGGGVFNQGVLTVTNTTISGNTAGNNAVTGQGGGVFNDTGSTLALTNSTIRENTAGTPAQPGSGGGIFNRGSLSVTSSTVSGNHAAFGGGIFNALGGSVTLTNSTVSANTVENAGGGIITSGSLTLLNSTVTGNTAVIGVGGLAGVAGNATVKNTIIAGNSGPGGGDCAAVVTSQGHNLDSDGTCFAVSPTSTDLRGVDAKLGPLRDNGGPTATQALLPASPAIDAGDSVGCPATDQRGVPRPQHGICDIGAVESVAAFGGGSLSISPASGSYLTTQGFDLVLSVNTLGRSIVSAKVTVDGADVTPAFLGCQVPGTLVTGGFSARCAGLRGGLFAAGAHTVRAILTLNDGTVLSDSVTWLVDANTEP